MMTSSIRLRPFLAVAVGVLMCTVGVKTAERKVRIIQTNSAGDNVHMIDPATNKVVGMIDGIEVSHGAASRRTAAASTSATRPTARSTSSTRKTLKVVKKIPLSGHPNNMAVSKDGRRVYVGIIQEPGGVDVIDTASMKRVKTIPTKGTIHNAYVTPDGKYVVAGSIRGQDDQRDRCATEEPAWTLEMDLGIRPMTFSGIPTARRSGSSRS